MKLLYFAPTPKFFEKNFGVGARLNYGGSILTAKY